MTPPSFHHLVDEYLERRPDVDPAVAQQPVHLLDAMLGQRAHGLGQATPHCMDCQRRTDQHPESGVGQRQHPFGMKVASVQGVYEAQEVASLKPPVG
jgi:hypothetical protein